MGQSLYEIRIKPCLATVKQLAASGLTNEDIADRFNVEEKVFSRYVKDYEELARALRQGRREMVLRVEGVVYKMAIGDKDVENTEIRRKRKKVGEDEETGLPIYQLVVDQKITKKGPNFEAARYFLEQRDPERWSKNPVVVDSGAANDSIKSVAELMNNPVKVRTEEEEEWV